MGSSLIRWIDDRVSSTDWCGRFDNNRDIPLRSTYRYFGSLWQDFSHSQSACSWQRREFLQKGTTVQALLKWIDNVGSTSSIAGCNVWDPFENLVGRCCLLDDVRSCLNGFKRFIEHYLKLSLFSLPNTQYFSIIYLKRIIIIFIIKNWIIG